MGSPAFDWNSVRRLLAVRLDNMGDVLMTTPALAAIKHTLPGAELTLLASPAGASLAPHLPFVDRVLAARAPWVKHAADTAADDPAALAAQLRRHRFDAAIVFTTYTQSALPAAMLALLARIPMRLAHARENPYDLLTHWIPEPEPALQRHEVERQLALVATAGFTTPEPRLRFALLAADVEAAERRLAAAGIDSRRPYIVVHPGASAPSRRYPAERLGSAVKLIAQRLPLPVVYTGSADEASLVARARASAGDGVAQVDLAGALSLGELAAVIGSAAVLIANNSGPAHIAAALRTPVVDLYALTNPQHTPWRTPARVLFQDVPCRNCFKSVCPEGHHACLLGVAPPQVALAALELLTGVTARAPALPLHRARALSTA
jgi:lipopolysaccharide heptosyltransferase II